MFHTYLLSIESVNGKEAVTNHYPMETAVEYIHAHICMYKFITLIVILYSNTYRGAIIAIILVPFTQDDRKYLPKHAWSADVVRPCSRHKWAPGKLFMAPQAARAFGARDAAI